MKAVYLIIAVIMLYMFIFVASNSYIGAAGPLLSVGFFGVFIYCLFLFATEWRQSRKEPDEQAEFKVRLKRLMKKSNQKYRPRRRRSGREYRE